MPSTTDTTSATTGGQSDIAAAADAWQDVLTPGRKARDTDDDQEQAQRPAKPTGKRAAAPEADEAEDDEVTAGEDAEEDDAEDAEGDDQGDEDVEADSEEEEADPDAEEEADEAEPDDTTYTVTHADGTQEDVTVDELVKGYYRQRDYTRKTQALAEDRRTVHAQHQEVTAMREQYARGLEELQEAIKQVAPGEPDWDALKASDPLRYAEEWADYQRRQHVVQQIEAERAQLREQQEAEQAADREDRNRRAGEWLVSQVPEWKDPAKRQADRAGMREYALKLGFTPQELQATDDPRAILMIRQAWQYAKLQERKGIVVKPKSKTPVAAGTKTPVLKPLAVKQPASKNATRTADAKKRHAREQSVASAANFFQAQILNR